MRLAAAVLAIVVAGLLVGVYLEQQPRSAEPLADTVSSVVSVKQATCIEKLDADGNVIETYYATRFVARAGPDRFIEARAQIEPELVTGPAGLVAFETVDGRRVFLEPPWRIP